MSSIRERQLRAKGIDPDLPQGGLTNEEWAALDARDRQNTLNYQKINNLRTDLNTARSGTSDRTVLRETETPVVNSVANQSQNVVSSQEILDNIEVVEDFPSRTEGDGDTRVYASRKVDGAALMAQMKAENEASELNNVIREALEDRVANNPQSFKEQITTPEEVPTEELDRVVEVEKTSAPVEMDAETSEAVKDLIEANPRNEKLQGVIEEYKDKYPDEFKDVNPKPLEELSEEEQEKRKAFIRAAEECNKSDSNTTGKIIIPPNPCRDTTFDKMEAHMTNLFNKIQGPAFQIPTIPTAQFSGALSAATGELSGALDAATGELSGALSSVSVGNFSSLASGLNLDMTSEIRNTAKVMSRSMNVFVNKATGSLNDKLSKSIGDGMAAFKAMEFSKISKAYPMTAALKTVVANQMSLAPKVMGMLDRVFCVGSKIQDGMVDSLTDLLTAAVKNTTNVPSCATQELMGAINNTIMNDLDNQITPLLGPISNILGPVGFKFDIKGVLGGGMDILKKADAFSSCDDRPSCPSSSKYIIGKGSRKGANALSTIGNFSKMASASALSNKLTSVASGALPNTIPSGLKDLASGALANLPSGGLPSGLKDLASAGALASGLSELASGGVSGLASGVLTDFEKKYGAWNIFGSPLAAAAGMSPCDTSNPPTCGGPTVEIFGGGGTGGAGSAILGNFIRRIDTEDIFASVKRTASIAGVEITDPGGGYTSDPVIAFDDECNQGYGAYGTAHVDKNPKSPTYGQITSITMISTGTNYPAQDEEVPLFIEKVIIENAGRAYADDDTLDNFELIISNGRIVGGTQLVQIPYSGLPELNINSETGVGAILRPVMSKIKPQGEVVQVIDCIGK